MNAHVKNKCEAEFLAVADEIINLFDLDVSLYTEALKEGGVREFINFIINEAPYSDKVATLAFVIAVLQLV